MDLSCFKHCLLCMSTLGPVCVANMGLWALRLNTACDELRKSCPRSYVRCTDCKVNKDTGLTKNLNSDVATPPLFQTHQ